MQTTTVITALVAAVIFGGLGWLAGSKSGDAITMHKHSHDLNPCKTATECKVKIAVDCDNVLHPTPASCEPYAEKAEVTQIGYGTTTSITFKSVTGAFEFDQTDGIKFSTLGNGNQVFTCTPDAGGDKQKYGCTITGATANQLFKYSIHMKGLDVTDPWVVNY